MKTQHLVWLLGILLFISCENSDGTDEVETPVQVDCSSFSIEVSTWTNSRNAKVTQTGGQQPITYSWSNGSTENTIGGEQGTLEAGTYTVTVKDGKGCEQKGSITITYTPVTLESSIECIGSDKAIIGTKITDTGDNEITERGICYSTSENPTVNDTKIISDANATLFNLKIVSLPLATTYYVRSYVITNNGVFYATQVSFTTKSTASPFTIGQRYQGGIIAHINCDGESGYILYTDGAFDTNTWIRAKEICEGSTLNGYSDWYLPSYTQVKTMYDNVHQAGIFTFKTGSTIYDNYWTSTSTYNSSVCGSKDGVYFNFSTGNGDKATVCYNMNFLPVRNF